MRRDGEKKPSGSADSTRRLGDLSGLQTELEEAIDAFWEVYKLLEDYAPVWYGEELHERTNEALRALGRG